MVSDYFQSSIDRAVDWAPFGLTDKELLDSAIAFIAKSNPSTLDPVADQVSTADKINLLKLKKVSNPQIEIQNFSEYNRQAGPEFDRIIRK